ALLPRYSFPTRRSSDLASRFLHSCPNVYTRHRIAPMNVHTPTYMRAPGESSGIFALESAMDELAVALNVDPVEQIRARRCRSIRSEEHTSELQSRFDLV